MAIDNKIIPHHWQVTLYVKPSLKESEKIELFDPVECKTRPFEFQIIGNGNSKKTQVIIDYKTNKFDEVLPDSKSEYEYAEETKARQYTLFLQNLMLGRMVYTRFFDPLDVEIASGPTLLNKDEVSKLYELKRSVGSSIKFSWRTYDVGDSLTESHNFWELGFQSKSKEYKNDVLRIADWLQRSEGEKDEIKSFILAWIAFNGLYGLFASITGKGMLRDINKFEHIIEELLINDASQIVDKNGRILDKLESYGVLSNSGTTNWSEELKKERMKSDKDTLNVLQCVVKCIYGVRKQVFHEAPQSEDIVERAQICKLMLTQIVATCLKNFVNY